MTWTWTSVHILKLERYSFHWKQLEWLINKSMKPKRKPVSCLFKILHHRSDMWFWYRIKVESVFFFPDGLFVLNPVFWGYWACIPWSSLGALSRLKSVSLVCRGLFCQVRHRAAWNCIFMNRAEAAYTAIKGECSDISPGQHEYRART